jgi:hypothetical protein
VKKLFFVVLSVSMWAQAQEFGFGVKGGIPFTNFLSSTGELSTYVPTTTLWVRSWSSGYHSGSRSKQTASIAAPVNPLFRMANNQGEVLFGIMF